MRRLWKSISRDWIRRERCCILMIMWGVAFFVMIDVLIKSVLVNSTSTYYNKGKSGGEYYYGEGL